eukprot:3356246-Rhodomonas_salina.1
MRSASSPTAASSPPAPRPCRFPQTNQGCSRLWTEFLAKLASSHLRTVMSSTSLSAPLLLLRVSAAVSAMR